MADNNIKEKLDKLAASLYEARLIVGELRAMMPDLNDEEAVPDDEYELAGGAVTNLDLMAEDLNRMVTDPRAEHSSGAICAVVEYFMEKYHGDEQNA